MLLRVDRLKRRICSFVGTRAATAGAVGVDRHVVWLEGRRGTFHNACLGGSKLLLQWWFKRVCGSTFLRFAVLGRRSIWAVLRLVAAWQFGTGVLWASVACFVNCTLIRQHPCPRVACYCAFAAQSGGGWWLAGEGARCLSVRGTRTLFRDRAGRGSNRCPGFLPGRTRVTCSVSHLRDFALLGSVSVTVVRWCLLFPPARASSSRQLCLGLASYGPVLRVSSIAH